MIRRNYPSCEILYGFSDRSMGDMRQPPIIDHLMTLNGLQSFQCIMGEQIHGTRVSWVTKKQSSTVIGIDGLLHSWKGAGFPSIVLGVRTADCVPLLIYDPVEMIGGVVHSGWRGTLGHIAKNAIEEFRKHGSKSENIYVILGPHIRSCCYDVGTDRIEQFHRVFGDTVVTIRDNKHYLDLTRAITMDLHSQGIEQVHIEDEHICTASNVHNYYSYRKDTKETFGEMLGFITISGYNGGEKT